MAGKKRNSGTDGVVEAAVLVDCLHGRAGAVVELGEDEAGAGVAAGVLDTHPGAVEAAKGRE